jgi:hypothetical protein
MPSWGKVRIANAGDHIGTRWAQECLTGDMRDASFVRVCFLHLLLPLIPFVRTRTRGLGRSESGSQKSNIDVSNKKSGRRQHCPRLTVCEV